MVQSVASRTLEQEVDGSIPGLGQYSFLKMMIVIATGFIHLTALHCFNIGSVGKQPVA